MKGFITLGILGALSCAVGCASSPYWKCEVGQCGTLTAHSLYHHTGGDVSITPHGSANIGGEAKPLPPPVKMSGVDFTTECDQGYCPRPSSLRRDVRRLQADVDEIKDGINVLQDSLIIERRDFKQLPQPRSAQ